MKKITMTGIKRGAIAAVTAGLMLATPAMAFAAGQGDIPAWQDVPVINKTWMSIHRSDSEVFDFQVKFDHAEQVGSIPTAVPTTDGKSMGGDDGAVATVHLNNKWSTDNTATIDGSDLLKDISFTAPGYYYFTVTEQAGTNPNIKYDTTPHTVCVAVAWKDGSLTEPEIKEVGIRQDGKKDYKGVSVTNKANDTDNLTISKTVAGTAANTNDEFTFTLTLDGLKGDYEFIKLGDDVKVQNDKSQDVTSVTNGTYTITMKHGQHLTIYNLPEGATYSVSENGTSYEESYQINQDEPVKNNVEVGDQISTGNKTLTGKQTTVAFKNEKGFAPGTGITMNTLPFVGVGAVAAAGAVTLVISRRRRAGESF